MTGENYEGPVRDPVVKPGRRPRTRKSTSPEMVLAHKRAHDAVQMRVMRFTYTQIAEELGLSNRSAARKSLLLGMKLLADETLESAEELRALDGQALDIAQRRVMEVMLRRHLVLYNGQPVVVDGNPVVDDGPTLQAAGALMGILAQRGKLFGLNVPEQHEVTGVGGGPIEMVHHIGELHARALAFKREQGNIIELPPVPRPAQKENDG